MVISIFWIVCSTEDRSLGDDRVPLPDQGGPMAVAADQLQARLQKFQARFRYQYSSAANVRILRIFSLAPNIKLINKYFTQSVN